MVGQGSAPLAKEEFQDRSRAGDEHHALTPAINHHGLK
jgi:hypothetical protein